METYQELNTRHKTEMTGQTLALDDARDLVRQIKRDIVLIQSRQTAERSAWYAQNAERKANEPKRPVGRPRKDDDTTSEPSRGIGIEPGTYVPPERDWTVWIESEDGPAPADPVLWKMTHKGRRIEYLDGTTLDL
jgi:hypothetical protein